MAENEQTKKTASLTYVVRVVVGIASLIVSFGLGFFLGEAIAEWSDQG